MIVSADVAIIGAGPVGLFTIFACGQLGMRCAVIDALPDPGGQLTALYPDKPIYDIPSRPAVQAEALVDQLLEQAGAYEPTYLMGQQANALHEDGDGLFSITTSAGATVQARAVIIAAGSGSFGPNRPPLEGLAAYEGTSVFYHVSKPERFRDRHVLIAGGGDSAVDWAVALAEIAASVGVVHRRDNFRAHPATVARMKGDPRITCHVPYQLEELIGDGGRLAEVAIRRIGGGRETLRADALIALFGLSADLSPLAGWGVAIAANKIPVDRTDQATSRAGIYAVGDVVSYPGKLNLILTGFAEAACAAHAAYARVFPGQALHFEHSTSRGAPAALSASLALAS